MLPVLVAAVSFSTCGGREGRGTGRRKRAGGYVLGLGGEPPAFSTSPEESSGRGGLPPRSRQENFVAEAAQKVLQPPAATRGGEDRRHLAETGGSQGKDITAGMKGRAFHHQPLQRIRAHPAQQQ